MHGMIGTNRKGRKRKSGRRVASGDLVRRPVDYRLMAALWPHRRDLPAAVRSDERAESEMGRLYLQKHISEHEYDAGRRYSVIVGAYLAMANAPRSLAGSGRGYPCTGAINCDPDSCICLARTNRFNGAYEAISEAAGQRASHKTHMAVNAVVIQDHACQPDKLDALKVGLSALAKHFGLTNQRKR